MTGSVGAAECVPDKHSRRCQLHEALAQERDGWLLPAKDQASAILGNRWGKPGAAGKIRLMWKPTGATKA